MELAERVANQIAGAIANAELYAQQREAQEEIRDLAKFPSENPSPVLRIAGDGNVMYANGRGELFLHLQGHGVAHWFGAKRGLKVGQTGFRLGSTP